jgi:hypothetical protein
VHPWPSKPTDDEIDGVEGHSKIVSIAGIAQTVVDANYNLEIAGKVRVAQVRNGKIDCGRGSRKLDARKFRGKIHKAIS